MWWEGARPRTLPAAVVPVAVGAACAHGADGAVWWRVVPALLVSLALQVGVNYANDYSDGIRGTDEARVGPLRLVGSGAAPAARVRQAAFLAFAAAGATASCRNCDVHGMQATPSSRWTSGSPGRHNRT
ncbi:MAG: hypothetical protein ACKORY_12240, partial [Actinomycetota bacterium]